MTTKPDWPSVPPKGPNDESQNPEMMLTDEEKLDPEMVRAMTQPFPEDDARPGDPDYLSEAELTKRWNALQQSIHGDRAAEPGRVVPFRQTSKAGWTAAAAAIALVFAGLFAMTQWRLQKLTTQPQAVESVVLDTSQTRGAEEPPTVTCKGQSLALIAPLVPDGYERFQIVLSEITQNAPRKWSATLQRGRGEALTVVVPCQYLHPSLYEVAVYGRNGDRQERLETYEIRVIP
jgi:hypothetical protein